MGKVFLCVIFAWAACSGGKHYSRIDGGATDGTVSDVSDGSGSNAVDAAIPDAPPAHFVVTFGGPSYERIVDMHGVSDGLVISGNVQSSSCTLGSTQLTYGYVVGKLDTAGGVVWARPQTYTDNLTLGATGTTPAGDVIVTGSFVGNVNFGGTTLTSTATSWDIFIAKYSGTNGSHMWSVKYGDTGPEHVQSMAVDQSGDIYVTGYWDGSGSYGGGTLTASGDDFFVAKYSGANGSYLWGIHGGAAGNDNAPSIAVDTNGVYVCGTFAGTINLGGNDLTSAGANDVFLASFVPSNGNHRWSERFGSSVTTSNETCNNVIVANSGVFMTGYFSSPLSVGGSVLVTQGSSDIYVAKYDAATGSHVWSKSYGGSGTDVPGSQLAVGSNLLVTGRFQQSISYSGGGTISSAGGYDVFVQTLAQSDGSYVDAFRTGGADNDEGTALATVNGDLVVGGDYQGVCYFGTTQEMSAGMTDAFVYEP